MQSLAEIVFLPRPRTVRPGAGAFPLRAGTRISLRGDAAALFPPAARLRDSLRRSHGMEWSIGAGTVRGDGVPSVDLSLDPRAAPAQGYSLRVAPEGILLSAQDPAGLFYGAATLAQVLACCPAAVPAGEILDSPDFPVRGVMLDISRDKVPTMETLFGLVDMLAGLKVNHIELYTEHTFAYKGHEEVWENASPVTGEDILSLDAYCRERFVDLVPNQNSFGHMQRWLSLPRYRGLSECPEGFQWPWGGRSTEPFTLDPSNPASLALLADLFGQLLPNFTSGLFNVGCDETFDLGLGRSAERCARDGKGRVYLEFLLKIHRLVKSHGRTMLYWGDIVMEHPDLVPELPRDAVALEWGYEATHPFDDHGRRLAEAGVPWWVCPGTSSWNSLAGRTDNCLANLRSAARAGLSHGATGFLNTDWGDYGHWQVLPTSFLGFAAGAALSWNCAGSEGSDFSRELDAHVFRDRAGVMGGLARDLGNAYTRTGVLLPNASVLHLILREPGNRTPPAGLRPESIAETRRWIERAASGLDSARMDLQDAGLVHDEYAAAVRHLLFACDYADALLDGTLADGSVAGRLRSSLHAVIGTHRSLWMRRNRIGGLSDSTARLEALFPSA